MQRSPASVGEVLHLGQMYIPLESAQQDEQVAYGYSVCSALRAKRVYMLMQRLNEQFNQQIMVRNCHGKYEEANLEATLKLDTLTGELYWAYNKKVVEKWSSFLTAKLFTDQSSILSNYCKQALEGKGRVSSLADGVVFLFSPQPGNDLIEVTILFLQQQVIQKFWSFVVNVSVNSDSYGHILSLSKRSRCPSTGEVLEIDQEFY